MAVETITSGAAPAPAQEPSAPSAPGAPTGQAWLTLIGVTGVLITLFWKRFQELYQTWNTDDNYSHGFLVPVISVYFAWRWVDQKGLPARGSVPFGLAWVLLGCLTHLLAAVVWYPPLDFVALVAILYGGAVLVGGKTWARGLAFPILFLFFMFPLPANFTVAAAAWLQETVAGLAGVVLHLFVPTIRDGYVLQLPGGQRLEVGEACSGLRQVVAFAALTLVIVHLSKRGWGYKIALFLSGFPVAVAANLLRVLLMTFVMRHFGAEMIGETPLGPEWLGLTYHTGWGLVTMAAGVLLLLGIDWWLKHAAPERGDKAAPTQHAETTATARPAWPGLKALPYRLGTVGACLLATLAGQGAIQAHLESAEQFEVQTLRKEFKSFPVSLGPWVGVDSEISSTAAPFYKAAADKLNRTYTYEGSDPEVGPVQVGLTVSHFVDGQDRLHNPLLCHQVAGYREIREARTSAPLEGETSGVVTRFCFAKKGPTNYVFYWHYTFEPAPAGEMTALQRLHRLRIQRLPSATVQVFVPAGVTPAQEQAVWRFVQDVNRRLRAEYVPERARLGSDTVPVRLVAQPPGTAP